MNKEKLNEVSFDELANDKDSKFYFHGLTGNEIKKIKKPTAHDPFFVTNKLSIAKSYADGFEKNIIYILRLNETKYFNFRKKSDWMKICKSSHLAELFQEEAELAGSLMEFSTNIGICFTTIQENDELMNKLKDQKSFNEYLKIISSDFDKYPEDFYDNEKYSVLESFLDNESSIGIISLWLIQFCRKDFIEGKLYLNLKDRSHGGDGAQFRRTIKEILFKQISERTNYKIVGEINTSDNDVEYSGFSEFAILDISAIKDIYPYPVKIEDASKILKKLQQMRK